MSNVTIANNSHLKESDISATYVKIMICAKNVKKLLIILMLLLKFVKLNNIIIGRYNIFNIFQ